MNTNAANTRIRTGNSLIYSVLFLFVGLTQVAHADLGDRVNQARNRATEARDSARAARDSVNEIRDKVREGVAQLTGQVRRTLEDAIDDAKRHLRSRLAGRSEFETHDCEPFRQELIGILAGLEALANTVQEMALCAGDEPLVDFSQQIALVESMPCRLLFPLSKVKFPACLVDQLYDGVDALQTLQMLIQVEAEHSLIDINVDVVLAELEQSDPSAGPDPVEVQEHLARAILDAELSSCRLWLEHYNEIMRAKKAMTRLSQTLNLLAPVFKRIARSTPEATIGIHGYTLITIKDTTFWSWGEYSETLSEYLGKLTDRIGEKMPPCVQLSIQDMIRKNQEAILQNQATILNSDG